MPTARASVSCGEYCPAMRSGTTMSSCSSMRSSGDMSSTSYMDSPPCWVACTAGAHVVRKFLYAWRKRVPQWSPSSALKRRAKAAPDASSCRLTASFTRASSRPFARSASAYRRALIVSASTSVRKSAIRYSIPYDLSSSSSESIRSFITRPSRDRSMMAFFSTSVRLSNTSRGILPRLSPGCHPIASSAGMMLSRSAIVSWSVPLLSRSNV